MQIKTYPIYFVCILLASSCSTLPISKDEPLDNIVLVTGDTLYGKVDYFKERYVLSEFYKKIRLQDTNGRKKRFKRKNVISYRVDGADYKSFRLIQRTQYFRRGAILDQRFYIDPTGQHYFLKLGRQGKLSYYELEWVDLDNNVIESIDLLKKAEDRFFVSGENRMLGLKRKLLSDYLSDCPQIQEKLKNKDLKWVFQVVDFYNENCVQE